MTPEGYAGRRLEILARDRARFGVGVVAEVGEVVRGIGGKAAFVVTDAGVVRSGVAGRVVDLLTAAENPVELFDGVEPNPGTAAIVAGSDRFRAFARAAGDAAVVIGLGGGSAMDSAKVIALHSLNERDVMSLGYHDPTLVPGAPVIAIPTTAGTGAE